MTAGQKNTLLITVLLVLSFLCGVLAFSGCCTGVGMECSSSDECALVGLDMCTSAYGDRGRAAFCTRECDTDNPCAEDEVCTAPFWLRRAAPTVCVPDDFVEVYRAGT